MAWSDKLLRPFVPESGTPIYTLTDARKYLFALPKSRHREPIIQATIEAVTMAAKGQGSMAKVQSGLAHVVHGPPLFSDDEKSDRLRLKRQKARPD